MSERKNKKKKKKRRRGGKKKFANSLVLWLMIRREKVETTAGTGWLARDSSAETRPSIWEGESFVHRS